MSKLANLRACYFVTIIVILFLSVSLISANQFVFAQSNPSNTPEKSSQQEGVVNEDSFAGREILKGVKLIRDIDRDPKDPTNGKFEWLAKNIEKYLKSGKIVLQKFSDVNQRGETYEANGAVHININLFPSKDYNDGTGYDPKKPTDTPQLLNIISVIAHEKYHSEHTRPETTFFTTSSMQEIAAYSYELNFYDEYVVMYLKKCNGIPSEKIQDKLDCLITVSALLGSKMSIIEAFNNGNFGTRADLDLSGVKDHILKLIEDQKKKKFASSSSVIKNENQKFALGVEKVNKELSTLENSFTPKLLQMKNEAENKIAKQIAKQGEQSPVSGPLKNDKDSNSDKKDASKLKNPIAPLKFDNTQMPLQKQAGKENTGKPAKSDDKKESSNSNTQSKNTGSNPRYGIVFGGNANHAFIILYDGSLDNHFSRGLWWKTFKSATEAPFLNYAGGGPAKISPEAQQNHNQALDPKNKPGATPFFDVGVLKSEQITNLTIGLAVTITEKEYNDIVDFINNYDRSYGYACDNCLTFVVDVAKQLDINLDPLGPIDNPKTFVKGLKELEKDPEGNEKSYGVRGKGYQIVDFDELLDFLGTTAKKETLTPPTEKQIDQFRNPVPLSPEGKNSIYKKEELKQQAGNDAGKQSPVNGPLKNDKDSNSDKKDTSKPQNPIVPLKSDNSPILQQAGTEDTEKPKDTTKSPKPTTPKSEPTLQDYDTFGEVPFLSLDLPGGTTIGKDGTVKLPGGTTIGKDGTVKLPGGTTIDSDGTIKLSDGTTVLPDGTVKLLEGTVKKSDGTIVSSTGNVIQIPSSIIKRPDGTIISPTGGIIRLPDSTIIDTANGVVKLPNNTLIGTDGTIRLPDGTVRLPDGTVMIPKDTTKPIKPTPPKPGSLPITLPDGTMIAYDGTIWYPFVAKPNDDANSYLSTIGKRPDGTFWFPDGTTIGKDGTIKLPGGTTIDKDGTIKLPGGKIISKFPKPTQPKSESELIRLSDGTTINKDGTITSPAKPKSEPIQPLKTEGGLKFPDPKYDPDQKPTQPKPEPDQSESTSGPIRTPDGRIIYPDGITINTDGTVTFPKGYKFPPDGIVRLPDGNVILPGGIIAHPSSHKPNTGSTKKDEPPAPTPFVRESKAGGTMDITVLLQRGKDPKCEPPFAKDLGYKLTVSMEDKESVHKRTKGTSLSGKDAWNKSTSKDKLVDAIKLKEGAKYTVEANTPPPDWTASVSGKWNPTVKYTCSQGDSKIKVSPPTRADGDPKGVIGLEPTLEDKSQRPIEKTISEIAPNVIYSRSGFDEGLLSAAMTLTTQHQAGEGLLLQIADYLDNRYDGISQQTTDKQLANVYSQKAQIASSYVKQVKGEFKDINKGAQQFSTLFNSLGVPTDTIRKQALTGAVPLSDIKQVTTDGDLGTAISNAIKADSLARNAYKNMIYSQAFLQIQPPIFSGNAYQQMSSPCDLPDNVDPEEMFNDATSSDSYRDTIKKAFETYIIYNRAYCPAYSDFAETQLPPEITASVTYTAPDVKPMQPSTTPQTATTKIPTPEQKAATTAPTTQPETPTTTQTTLEQKPATTQTPTPEQKAATTAPTQPTVSQYDIDRQAYNAAGAKLNAISAQLYAILPEYERTRDFYNQYIGVIAKYKEHLATLQFNYDDNRCQYQSDSYQHCRDLRTSIKQSIADIAWRQDELDKITPRYQQLVDQFNVLYPQYDAAFLEFQKIQNDFIGKYGNPNPSQPQETPQQGTATQPQTTPSTSPNTSTPSGSGGTSTTPSSGSSPSSGGTSSTTEKPAKIQVGDAIPQLPIGQIPQIPPGKVPVKPR